MNTPSERQMTLSRGWGNHCVCGGLRRFHKLQEKNTTKKWLVIS